MTCLLVPVAGWSLLSRHRELEPLLGADHMVDVLRCCVDVDLHRFCSIDTTR